MYRILTGKSEIRKAQNILENNLRSGKRMIRVVGYQGGSDEEKIFWHDRLGYWSVCRGGKNRYWVAFGTQDPNRMCQGVFLLDDRGGLHLGHRGRVNKVKKSSFRRRFRAGQRGEWVQAIDDKGECEVLRLHPLKDSDLLDNLGSFISEISRIKKTKGNGKSKTGDKEIYSPENEEETEYSPSQDPVVMRKRHAKVVNALKSILSSRYPKVAISNRPHDILLPGVGKGDGILFEVKAESDTQSIHTMVGQLFIYSDSFGKKVKKVAVLPSPIPKETATVLSRLGIRLITFRLTKARTPKFQGLEVALGHS